MKHLLLVVLSFVAPAVHAQAAKKAAAPAGAPSVPLATLFERYHDRTNRLFPLRATVQGDNRFNDKLPNDQTRVYRDTLRAFYTHYSNALRRVNRAALTPNDQLSYDILRYELDQELAAFRFNNWMMPFNQFYGLPTSLPQLGSGKGAQPFNTVKDYDNWLARMRSFPAWTDSAIANFQHGERSGIVLPKALVTKMIAQLKAVASADPTTSLFFAPVANFPKTFTPADKARLTPLYQSAIRRDVLNQYRKLTDFLEVEYLPKARTTSGINALPQGAARYAYAVQVGTTTARTPAQIYETGLAEVARIRAEMDTAKNRTGFKGDLKGYFNYVNTDPKFRPFKTEAEVINAFRAIQGRVEVTIPTLFSRGPKALFEVRATEAYRAASASAQYNRGAPDGSRPGIFYVPILDATKYNTVANPAMETLFLHEALPGHHFQASMQQENTALPKFRRFGGYSACSEGWGLYCESLGKSLGLYTDPNQYMGHLGAEMHRALRLVTDVGLHTGKLTREQAIQYMMDNEVISEQGATAEVERYMAIPGQALSYKTGQLKLTELRDRYRQQLGAKFDLRAFHDELLSVGQMPLAVLETHMDAWAARIK
ncbi:DUF885 domain-containing protein [Hymenobacter negativus]|uniref:DUF885 domain-containing protein n=1 Tax=Hymenobacter negativus TaxID=2795026 RepID=A0ABS3QHM8_9BACT|nr:DUF885 domain-containing protein [Hymenobacter negativus]MBO2010756.1 DUF885 domain-containing protein [Hymenobacter negativus]